MSNEAYVEELVGQTFTRVEGGKHGDEELRFYREDGTGFRFFHAQDCCETVQIEDVAGDFADLMGVPILSAYAESNERGEPQPEFPDSWTWTFYRFMTVKGMVVISWLGESNGYYNEDVDIERF